VSESGTEQESGVVTIEALAAGGAGVAHLPDGMIVFVPRTAPGDRVRLHAVRRHRRHALAQVRELVEPGPDRVEPRCVHYTADRCGGCQWQHVAGSAQLSGKRRLVGDALRRIGALAVDDPELVESPRSFGYRATITLTVRWRGRQPVVGFHDGVDPDRVFGLGRCEIARPEVQALWEAVRPAVAALPKGDDVRLRLRVAPDTSLHVVVDGGARAWTGGGRVETALREAGLTATVWWKPARGAARRVAGAPADPAAVAFEQVNAEVADQLRDAVLSASEGAAGARVLDLYAGAGETALPLAARGMDVTMVEVDVRAVRRAQARAEAQGLTLRTRAALVEACLPTLLPADIVVANPPRAGLAEAASAALARAAAGFPWGRFVYVSCDPATLARDLRRLDVRREQVRLLRCYDMFPQTSHVETLVVFDR